MILPPIVTLPTTSKLPVINVLFCKLIVSLAAVTIMSPVIESILLLYILILPVVISVGVIIVVLVPSVKVTPSDVVMF